MSSDLLGSVDEEERRRARRRGGRLPKFGAFGRQIRTTAGLEGRGPFISGVGASLQPPGSEKPLRRQFDAQNLATVRALGAGLTLEKFKEFQSGARTLPTLQAAPPLKTQKLSAGGTILAPGTSFPVSQELLSSQFFGGLGDAGTLRLIRQARKAEAKRLKNLKP